MMVIAARAEKQRAGIAPDGFVEPETGVVEGVRFFEAADTQVHVPHRRPRGRAVPRTPLALGDHAVDVQRIGRQDELSTLLAPRAARAVGVDLDAESVRI